MTSHRDQAYSACLRFFVELRALGVTDVVVSPGSRSTVLALSAAAVDLRLTVHHDERVGSYHALGAARASRRPIVLICTSGTAAANYHPAVIEAHHAGVPLIVCTSDRPPELRTWGAGQTIDQVKLYGNSVRWYHETPVGDEIDEDHARALALRAHHQATDRPGPVHLNWPFREPLQPSGPLMAPSPTLEASPQRQSVPSARIRDLAERFERGLVVVGPADLSADEAREIAAFGDATGWPIIADPASGMRAGPASSAPTLITTAELLLAVPEVGDALGAADVVVRVGLSPTSKAYRLWLEKHRPRHLLLVDPAADWSDPTNAVTEVVSGPVAGLFASEAGEARSSAWRAAWSAADASAAAAASTFVADDDGELGIVKGLVDQMAASGQALNLVVSNSMPVRDLDFVMRPTAAAIRVIANRGANGIDGVIATGLGVASVSDAHTYVLVGDVATVHDLGGLAAITRLGVASMTVVVIDNDAGGIFSILPVRDAVPEAVFDRLFTTPHGTDLPAIGAAMGFAVTVIGPKGDIERSGDEEGNPRLIVVRTDVPAMTDGVASLRQAVAEALR
ncbi:MAG: 2-succinyl-5-enolpyruvyl-6-hydroxy-3-cyclohexene-1-carboxylic-acid synthase [Actinomycetota bacterium]